MPNRPTWLFCGILASLGASAGRAAETPSVPPAVAVIRADESNPWPNFKTPAQGGPEVIGDYNAGCVRGARSLPENASHYQIMRPKRGRVFAHPDLISFIENLASRAQAKGLGILLVGDLGQPRGGPGPKRSHHFSHEAGLEADIWYWRAPNGRMLTDSERDSLNAPTMVVPDFERPTSDWKPDIMDMLKLAAEDERTDRIFVNPIIKREVCAAHAGEAWVRRLRPWWGHDDHFHVRLQCPKSSASCRPTHEDPIPAGDGCGDVASWLTQAKRDQAKYDREHPKYPKFPQLPAGCRDLLKP